MSTRNRTTENFPVGSRLVAPAHRPAVHAFYRFARAADDIADDPAREADAKTALLEAHDKALVEGIEGPEEALALRVILLERGLATDHPRQLLQAFLADARGRPCRTWSDLIAYCRFSAAPVGRFLLDLHGEDKALWPASDALCTALQIGKFDRLTSSRAKQFIKPFPREELLAEIDIFCELFRRPVVQDALRKFVESTDALPYLP